MSHLRHGRPHRIRGWALVRARARLPQRRYMRLIHYTLTIFDGPDETNDLQIFQQRLIPSVVTASPRRREICIKMDNDKLMVTLRTDREFHAWCAAFVDASRQFYHYYKLVASRTLGSGAFSTVYFAYDRHDGHHVAVKLVDKTTCSRVELAYAETEARMMVFVRHACIVQCRDIFDAPDAMHVVMQYMSADTLEKRLMDTPPARRVLCETVAATIMSRLLDALAYLEAQNVCHRDIKPDNILLSSFPNENLWATTSRLSDFGLAAFVESDNDLTAIVGTPNYLAPEVITRNRHDNQRKGYGPPVDVWAAGIIMYWLLTGGNLPFDAPDAATVLKNIRTAELCLPADPWNRISNDAKSLLCALLHPDPRTRLRASAARFHPWLRHSQQLLSVTTLALTYRRVGALTAPQRWRVAVLALRAFHAFRALADPVSIIAEEHQRRGHLHRVAEKRRHETQRRSDYPPTRAPERAPPGADGLGYNIGFIPSFTPKRRARAAPISDTAALLRSTSSFRSSSASLRSASSLESEKQRVRMSVESASSGRSSVSTQSTEQDCPDDGSVSGSSSSTRSALRSFRLRARIAPRALSLSRGSEKLQRALAERCESYSHVS